MIDFHPLYWRKCRCGRRVMRNGRCYHCDRIQLDRLNMLANAYKNVWLIAAFVFLVVGFILFVRH